MRRFVVLTALAAATIPAVRGSAQETPPPSPSREPGHVYSFSFGSDGPEQVISLARRGRLGVTVDMRADPARDSIGALVAGVLPGGAADRAGVRAGDIVTRFNGTRLAAGPGGEDADSDQSRPALRLINFASRLDPGDTVRLEVRRAGRPQTFTFQAEESDMDVLYRRMAPFARDLMPMTMPPDAMRGGVMLSVGDALSDLEMVKMNAGLGDYFGTSDGLLVTSVGADSALGLRPGDVILTIGGRHPESPVHAMRILSTYDSGESIQFDVMRQHHRTSVTGRMPEARETHWRIRQDNYELPMVPGQPFIDSDGPMLRIQGWRSGGASVIET